MSDSNDRIFDQGMDRRTILQGLAAAGGASLLSGQASAAYDLSDETYTKSERMSDALSNRDSTKQDFISGLTEHTQETTTEYTDSFTLPNGHTARPWLYTKGFNLHTDSDGNRYPSAIAHGAQSFYLSGMLGKVLSGPEDGGINGGGRDLISPYSAHSFATEGVDPWRTILPAPPAPTSDQMAAEMIDVYMMVFFRDSDIEDLSDSFATQELDRIENTLGKDWWHSGDRLFVEADTNSVPKGGYGPYVSQFLLHDVMYGAFPFTPKLKTLPQGANRDRDLQSYLDLVEGIDPATGAEASPPAMRLSNGPRFVSTPRDLAAMVNFDPSYYTYLMAALNLLGQVSEGTASLDPALAYMDDGGSASDQDDGYFNYLDGGPVALLDFLGRAARNALLAAWYQKWFAHFRLRPETYSGRIESELSDSDAYAFDTLGISDLVLQSDYVDSVEVFGSTNTHRLPQAYTEGAPAHPAYPSGHSCIAGACGTVLKTFFQNDKWTTDYYRPSDGGDSRESVSVPSDHKGIHQEIDKLMSNVGLGRMFAGVHYYSDHYWGIKLGEQVAVAMMQDTFDRSWTPDEGYSPTFSEFFGNYHNRNRDSVYENQRKISTSTLESLRQNAATRTF